MENEQAHGTIATDISDPHDSALMAATGIRGVADRYFRIALTWSILLVLGIPMIVFGAVNLSKGWYWVLLMVLGIIFTATGVFAVPIMWVQFASKKHLSRVAIVVSGTESVTIDILSDTMGQSQEKTREDVRKLLKKGWLPGYAFVDQEDRVRRTSALDIHHAVCEYCGASFEFKGTDSKCPYCGRWFTGKPLD